MLYKWDKSYIIYKLVLAILLINLIIGSTEIWYELLI